MMAAAYAALACAQILGDDFEIVGNGAGGAASGSTSGNGAATGVGGSTLMCEGTTADCDLDAVNGCEVELTTDGDHCGTCDHSCLGGECVDSVCKAVQLVVGDPNDWPRDVAVDGANVYWTNESGGTVMRVPKGGGTSVEVGWNQPFAYGVAVDGMRAYWTTRQQTPNGTVGSAPLGGGAPSAIMTNLDLPEAIGVDATHLYWLARSGLYRADKMAPVPGMIASASIIPGRLILDPNYVYWTDYNSGAINRTPKGGGATEGLASGQVAPLGIAIDATSAYWVNFMGNTVYKVDIATRATTELCAAESPRDVVVDDDYAYFTNSASNTIRRVAKDGGESTIIADNQNGARDIAQDEEAVYWANVDGSVWKIAK